MRERGLQLALAAPDALAAQIRAIVEAGVQTELRLLLPLVASADELRHVQLYSHVQCRKVRGRQRSAR